MQELVSVIEDESVNWLCAGLKQLQGLAARPKATMLGTSIFLALSRLSETSVGTSSSRDLCIGFIRLDLINSWVKFG